MYLWFSIILTAVKEISEIWWENINGCLDWEWEGWGQDPRKWRARCNVGEGPSGQKELLGEAMGWVRWCCRRVRGLKDPSGVLCFVTETQGQLPKDCKQWSSTKQAYFLGRSVCALWVKCVRGSLGTFSALGRCWADNLSSTYRISEDHPSSCGCEHLICWSYSPTKFLGVGCLIQASPPWGDIPQKVHKCKIYILLYISIYDIRYMQNYM